MRTRDTPKELLLTLAGVLLATIVLVAMLGAARGAASEPPSPKLPDLVADAPDGIGLATDTSTGTPHLLLRFNGYIHNVGTGALDFRGTRVAPALSPATAKKVKEAEEKKEGLSPEIEAELAASPMHATQRLFTTEVGKEETNIERAHVEEPSSAQLIFSSADGHHHWHLQHAAKYSLWNSAKSAEVAPAQKAGFCLDDSQHVEVGKGPSKPVYADAVPPFRDFCQQYKPNATSLFEGISSGWRDLYDRELAFQWVDASNVLPGEYWLREEVNPEGVVKETGGANVPAYAANPTIIPGFDANAQAVDVGEGEASTVTLTSHAWSDSATPVYKVLSQPHHGTLKPGGKPNQEIYTPEPGYVGADSFTFSAADPNSQFPNSPAVATVAVNVGPGQGEPSVTLEGVPASITAGTSVQLGAHVVNDSATVTWSASAGSISDEGLYTAPAEPPVGGKVTISATTIKGAHDEATIEVLAQSATGLLAGDATKSYAFSDQTTAGREEAFQFTAGSSGTVEELQFRTNATANTGVTGLVLGVLAENAGEPGEVLGSAMAAGTPATNSWIKVGGLSTALTSGTKYWLVALPLGPASAQLHFNSAVASGGTGNLESTTEGLTSMSAESSWVSYGNGPVGFQALGSIGLAKPSVTITGAPASIGTGSSTQLTAQVLNDSPTVSWSASAGSITPEGLFTAPGEVPVGGTVTITATTAKGAHAEVTVQVLPAFSVAIEGAPAAMTAGTSVQLSAVTSPPGNAVEWQASAGSITPGGLYTAPLAAGTVTVAAKGAGGGLDQRTITILPVPTPQPAPEAPTPPIPAGGVKGELLKGVAARVTRPHVALIGRELIMTTLPSVAGRVRLSAYLGHRRLGTCVTRTPANRSFTCRLRLARSISKSTHISVLASLRVGATIVSSRRPAAPITQMKMNGGAAGALAAIAAAKFWCSPLAGNAGSG